MYAGCRCPRCVDAVLAAKVIEGCEVLACRRCGGAFVGAAVGLRLLALLRPEVPPHDPDTASSACPVCRTGMKLVQATAAGVSVDTCAKHGVWFDAGDLGPVVRAVAKALGKPVPAIATGLEKHATRAPETSTPVPPSSAPRWIPQPLDPGLSAPRRRPRDLPAPSSSRPEPIRDFAAGVSDLTGGVIEGTVGAVVDGTVEITGAVVGGTVAIVGSLFDLLGD